MPDFINGGAWRRFTGPMQLGNSVPGVTAEITEKARKSIAFQPRKPVAESNGAAVRSPILCENCADGDESARLRTLQH